MRISIIAAVAVFSVSGLGDALAGAAGRCGGTGGGTTKTLTCPSGEFIGAIGARGGAFVDQFSIACRKYPVGGQQGPLGEFKTAGPGGGTSSASGKCGNGHGVYGIIFSSGGFVDKVRSAGCRERKSTGWSEEIGTPSSISIGIGGVGGGQCSIACPIGEAMYQVTVKSGGWIDSISGQCRR